MVGRVVRRMGRRRMVVALPSSVGVHERMSGVIEKRRGHVMWVWHAVVTVVIAVIMRLQKRTVAEVKLHSLLNSFRVKNQH